MTDIIKQWIVKKLGLPCNFHRGADRLRMELSNGHLIGEILRKYHLISDDMLMNLTDSVCHHDRDKNMHILHNWLQSMSFGIEIHELEEIREAKPGAALSFLYRMYLWLEGPGAKPGLQPRQILEDMAVSSEDTIEGRDNWISYITDRYVGKDSIESEVQKYKDLLKERQESKERQEKGSFIDDAEAETDELVPLSSAEAMSALKSAEFLRKLEKSLPYKEPTKEYNQKILVSQASVMDLDISVNTYGEGKINSTLRSILKRGSTEEDEKRKMSQPEGEPESQEIEDFEPYLEVDGKGLEALECGQLPSFYIRNFPYGNTHEKLQAGNVYFHSKAMMLLEEQRLSARRDSLSSSRTPKPVCENQPFVGIYEETLKYRKEKKLKKRLTAMENTISDMKKFDERLIQEESSEKKVACEDLSLKIYPHGRGDWTEASSKIAAIKDRRRKEKVSFQKRSTMRKMMAAAIVKSNACEMHEELDKTIHNKLLLKSKQENFLADYCASSHLEKRAFLDHIKFEQEQLLNMGLLQVAKECVHQEQLDEIRNKVEKILEDNGNHIMSEVRASKHRAKLIIDIKFCEEIFMVILKTAIQISVYRAEYGSDPPKAQVAEWRSSFYLGDCIGKLQIESDEKLGKYKKNSLDQDGKKTKRCKKKKKKLDEKDSLKGQKRKSKSSNKSLTSIKSDTSNKNLRVSPILEDHEEEEMEAGHAPGGKHVKRKHSHLHKHKHQDNNLPKTGSNDSVEKKTTNLSQSEIKDEDGTPHKGKRRESNIKKTKSKNKDKRKVSMKAMQDTGDIDNTKGEQGEKEKEPVKRKQSIKIPKENATKGEQGEKEKEPVKRKQSTKIPKENATKGEQGDKEKESVKRKQSIKNQKDKPEGDKEKESIKRKQSVKIPKETKAEQGDKEKEPVKRKQSVKNSTKEVDAGDKAEGETAKGKKGPRGSKVDVERPKKVSKDIAEKKNTGETHETGEAKKKGPNVEKVESPNTVEDVSAQKKAKKASKPKKTKGK